MKHLLICILNIFDYLGLVSWLTFAFPRSIHALVSITDWAKYHLVEKLQLAGNGSVYTHSKLRE